jgi:hypothetical protein
MRHQIKLILIAAVACGVLAGKAEAFHLLPVPHHFGGFHALGGVRGPLGHLGGGTVGALHRGFPGPGQGRFADIPRSREAYGRGFERGGRSQGRYTRGYGYPGAYGGYAYGGYDDSNASCYDAYGRRAYGSCH